MSPRENPKAAESSVVSHGLTHTSAWNLRRRLKASKTWGASSQGRRSERLERYRTGDHRSRRGWWEPRIRLQGARRPGRNNIGMWRRRISLSLLQAHAEEVLRMRLRRPRLNRARTRFRLKRRAYRRISNLRVAAIERCRRDIAQGAIVSEHSRRSAPVTMERQNLRATANRFCSWLPHLENPYAGDRERRARSVAAMATHFVPRRTTPPLEAALRTSRQFLSSEATRSSWMLFEAVRPQKTPSASSNGPTSPWWRTITHLEVHISRSTSHDP